MKSLIVATGPERSGTSVTAHALSALGIDMGREIGAEAWNEHGHHERFELALALDRVLSRFDAAMFTPRQHRALPPGWWTVPEVRAIRDEVAAWLRASVWPLHRPGMKDPRLCRLMPLLDEALAAAGMEGRFLLCLRHPAETIASMVARDGTSADEAAAHWMRWNLDFLRHMGRRPFLLVRYDGWTDQPERQVRRVAGFCGLPLAQALSIVPALSGIFSPALRHHRAEALPPAPEACLALWRLLAEAEDQGGGAHRMLLPYVDAAAPLLDLMARTADRLAALRG